MTVKEIREKTGLSQSKFCKRFHLGLKALQNWEQGQRKTPEHVIYLISYILELEEKLGR